MKKTVQEPYQFFWARPLGLMARSKQSENQQDQFGQKKLISLNDLRESKQGLLVDRDISFGVVIKMF